MGNSFAARIAFRIMFFKKNIMFYVKI